MALLLTAILARAFTLAYADGPGVGVPYIVSVGDSYISGEAGRWAGNTNGSPQSIDALGPTAYFDNPGNSAELINRCHRSKSAEVYIGEGVMGMNLACSGATTSSHTDSDGYFKPGLDFYNAGQKGQALLLQEFAASHNVRMIAVSIGGNDFHFADIVQTCVVKFLTSLSLAPDYCQNDPSVLANFSPDNLTKVTTAIAKALLNLAQAMTNAGYSDNYTLLVQIAPSPLPAGAGFRYGEAGYTRQSVGGCGFWNADSDWANATVMPLINGTIRGAVAQSGLSNVQIMDLSAALVGRRLCENTVGLLEEQGLGSWREAGAVDKTEWVNEIRTLSTLDSDFYLQESFHPNYWGQLALRNCLRQAYNRGSPRGGACTIAAPGLNLLGEPNMLLR